jgi:hypothetical protein
MAKIWGSRKEMAQILENRKVEKSNVVRGNPIEVVDLLGNVLSLPEKLLLLCMKIDNHMISEGTERMVHEFISHHNLKDIKIRLNQYAPHDEFLRLFKNSNIHILIRLTIGLLTCIGYLLNPGRIFGGDFYNPFSNSVNIFSDHVAIALHELGHALDFRNRKYPGLYALMRLLPFVALYQEYIASKYAIQFLRKNRYYREERAAYKILYPAYSTYVFGALYELIPSPIIVLFYLPFIALGHLLGRIHAFSRPQKIGPEPPLLEPPKFNKIPFFSMLAGFLLGFYLWNFWGALISGVLSYYICKEVIQYHKQKKEREKEQEEVKVPEIPSLNPPPDPKELIKRLYVLKEKMEQYLSLLTESESREVFSPEFIKPFSLKIANTKEAIEKTILQIETKEFDKANEEYEKVDRAVNDNSISPDLQEYSAFCNDTNLFYLHENNFFGEISQKLKNFQKGKIRNRFLKYIYTITSEKITQTNYAYLKAQGKLRRGVPRVVLKICSDSLALVSDHNQIKDLRNRAQNQIDAAEDLLQQAKKFLSSGHYYKASKLAKRSIKLDEYLHQKAEEVIRKAIQKRRVWQRKVLITAISMSIIAYASVFLFNYYMRLSRIKSEFETIMKYGTAEEDLQRKKRLLLSFLNKYPSNKYSNNARKEVTKVDRQVEGINLAKLDRQCLELEKSKNYEKMIKLHKKFLIGYPSNIHRSEIEEKISDIEKKMEVRDYKVVLEKTRTLLSDERFQEAESLYKGFLVDYHNSFYTKTIEEKIQRIHDQIDHRDYEKLKKVAERDYQIKLMAYNKYLSDHPKGKYFDIVKKMICDMKEQFYQDFKKKLEIYEKNEDWKECMELCNKTLSIFGSDERYAELKELQKGFRKRIDEVSILANLKYLAEGKDADYEAAKLVYTEYLESNNDLNSFMKKKITNEIESLDKKFHKKREWEIIAAYIENQQNKLSRRIAKLKGYINKEPDEQYIIVARNTLKQLEKKHQDADKARRLAEEKKRKKREQREWEKAEAICRNPEISVGYKISRLNDYISQPTRKEYLEKANKYLGWLKYIDGEEEKIRNQVKDSDGIYIENQDGTVTDVRTGLMWCSLDSDFYIGKCLQYGDAMNYVNNLKTGGYRDWRLPTCKELAGIYKKKPFFPSSSAKWYWTCVIYGKYIAVVTTEREIGWRESKIEYDRGCGSVRAVRP